jgi:hypothetical protein
LGERLAGSQKVAGSSPAGSIHRFTVSSPCRNRAAEFVVLNEGDEAVIFVESATRRRGNGR